MFTNVKMLYKKNKFMTCFDLFIYTGGEAYITLLCLIYTAAAVSNRVR